MRYNVKSISYIIVIAALILSSLSISSVSATTYSVYVYPKNEPYHWKGMWWSYFAGALYVKVRSSSNPEGQTARAYCINYDGVIYTGTEYSVSLTQPPDNPTWKAIAYVLTWYDGGGPIPSGGPASDAVGVHIQGALWQLLGSIAWKSWIPNSNSYWTGIQNLVTEATGKDVVRSDDKFEWISPLPGSSIHLTANPGDTVTLSAKITNKGGVPRPHVKVEFLVNDVLFGTGLTDSNGVVNVNVPVTGAVADIVVKAQTKGIWPQYYLDLTGDHQDLLGLDTCYNLTVTANLWIFAYIHVVPEIPFGALAAVVTCFFAYKFKTRKAGHIN